jgi:hypothetical protein
LNPYLRGFRHCGRSEAIQLFPQDGLWIASLRSQSPRIGPDVVFDKESGLWGRGKSGKTGPTPIPLETLKVPR